MVATKKSNDEKFPGNAALITIFVSYFPSFHIDLHDTEAGERDRKKYSIRILRLYLNCITAWM